MTDATLDIARATQDDAIAVDALLVAAGRDLAQRGFDNWAVPYPLDRLRIDIDTREVWIVRRDTVIVATYTIASTPPRQYEPSPWPDPLARAIYFNRLAVDPSCQSRGIGAQCLDAMVRRARELGVVVLRCDVFAANPSVRRFYERRGFVLRGERRHAGRTFVSYESVVPNDVTAPIR